VQIWRHRDDGAIDVTYHILVSRYRASGSELCCHCLRSAEVRIDADRFGHHSWMSGQRGQVESLRDRAAPNHRNHG
jgi:hypothetical protein